jgi:toxin-antitoxin system PIN domain toxin
MTPDVNVLVAAYRPDHPHHQSARAWLDDAVINAANGRASLMLLGTVVTDFLRITTNPKIFHQTDPLQDLTDFIDSLLSCPRVQLQPQGATWRNLKQVCLTQQIIGNLLSDAWIAATVMQSGETLCTFDREFVRLLPSSQLFLLKP